MDQRGPDQQQLAMKSGHSAGCALEGGHLSAAPQRRAIEHWPTARPKAAAVGSPVPAGSHCCVQAIGPLRNAIDTNKASS